MRGKYDPAGAMAEDRPARCPSCGTAWSAHDGLIVSCRKIAELRAALSAIAEFMRLAGATRLGRDSKSRLLAMALRALESR